MKPAGINRARSFGFLGGLMLAMAAVGVFWLVTPMAHPDATALQSLLVIAQVVLGVVLAVWCWVAAGRVAESVKEEAGSET
ncbi:MAG: hypothetical protein ABR551_04260 [Gemmatimonadales bacterium]